MPRANGRFSDSLCCAGGFYRRAANGVLTRSDHHVVAHQTLYGCTYSLISNWLPRYRISHALAVSLGQIKTLIECPYTMTHAAVPPEQKAREGLVPGGIRLSVGLEDRYDLVAELAEALEHV